MTDLTFAQFCLFFGMFLGIVIGVGVFGLALPMRAKMPDGIMRFGLPARPSKDGKEADGNLSNRIRLQAGGRDAR